MSVVRILQVGLSSNPGGVENLVFNYHKHIDKKQFVFDYLDIYNEGIAFQDEIKQMGGKIYYVPNYKRHPIMSAKAINDLLDRQAFDIIHIHMQSAANLLPIEIALKKKNLKIICHSHSSSTPNGIIRKVLNAVNQKKLREYPIYKWACGKNAGKWMWGEHFHADDIVPNAIEYNLYKKDEKNRKILRSKLGFQESDRIMGFVGRFGDEKNTFFLIEVLKELLKLSKNYKLLTVGGNGLYDLFCKKINEEGLNECYYSAGIQKNTRDWYQVMDCFLLPSFFEGFPMVGVEAQAAGIPCFLSDRISDEINISNTVTFMSIDDENSAKNWAYKIHDRFLQKEKNGYYFPEEYKIEMATQLLEEKYFQVINR